MSPDEIPVMSPEFLREIHKIREEMYEEMRDMTSAERVKKNELPRSKLRGILSIKEEAEACKKEFGLALPQKIIIRK